MEDLKYQVDLLTAMNEKLMNSEHIYRLCSEFSGNLFIYYNLRGDRHTELIGDWDELTGEKISRHPYDENYMLSFVCDEDQKLVKDKILDLDKRGEVISSCEFKSRNKRLWFSASTKVIFDANRNPIEKIVCLKNITKQKHDSEEVEYFAYHDSLTSLYNRNFFVMLLREFVEKADAEKNTVEVMLVDIDNFKKINDSLGLVYGDELVQDFGLFLKEFQNDYVKVCRFGSDVFGIAVYSPCGTRSCDMIFKSINERLRKPFILTNNTEIAFSVSAGVSEYPGGGKSALELIKNTEIVLYVSKEKNKGGISYFDESMLNKFLDDINIETKLKDAISNNQFTVYFQPLFDTEDGKMRGAEALLRWPDDEGGFVCGPNVFIPLAEKNGSIISLGNFVFREVFQAIHDWKIKYRANLIISINVSAIQLKKDNFIDDIQKYMDLYEVDPESLEIEITESVLINNFDETLEKIKTLRRMGIRVSLDDFGTGFSSLSYLRQLPINTLKIDKSFVDNIENDDKTTMIIGSVIDMVKKLNLESVAEGVEDKNQLDFLKEQGCNNIQGYLLSKPVTKAEFEKLIIKQLP
ncbi:MAG: bifunctional diguanylate cyclase/phosphodiesterase [Lachnospiraceae bacterium]|nr:bifunctional diguanylate cyclase/phosphodiesterase [Lachnospiraceae bacterium]